MAETIKLIVLLFKSFWDFRIDLKIHGFDLISGNIFCLM